MTKTIIIGQDVSKNKKKKSIEFLYSVEDGICTNPVENPSDFKYVELIAEGYLKFVTIYDNEHDSLDLMFGYDDPKCRGNGSLYYGHWNDGVV